MALLTDTSLDFDVADVGNYTFDSNFIEFVAPGIARLKVSAGGRTETIETPDVDRSGWGTDRIHKVAFTIDDDAVDNLEYYHTFLVSFDQGFSWKRYDQFAGWVKAEPRDIKTRGMRTTALEKVSLFIDTSDIRFLIGITRETGAGTGDIDLITISRGTTDQSWQGADPGTTVLPTFPSGATMTPNFPLDGDLVSYGASISSDFGYPQRWMKATKQRRFYRSLIWGDYDLTDRDTILAFLRAHQGEASQTHISWQPIGYDSAGRWVAGEPTYAQVGANLYSVRCDFIEVFSHEVGSV